MNSAGRHLLILIIVLILTGFLAVPAGGFYGYIFGIPRALGIGSFLSSVSSERFGVGLVPAFVLLLTLTFTALGAGKRAKYWWIGVLLLPALAFVIYFDLSRIWFYAILGVVGWAIGFGITKLSGLRGKQPR